MNVTNGARLTIIGISVLGTTVKDQVILERLEDKFLIYRDGGSPMTYRIDKSLFPNIMIFHGHNIAIKTDEEAFNTNMNNGCFNLSGMPKEQMRSIIETKNINNLFTKHADIICWPNTQNPIPLYPELETNNLAIINARGKNAWDEWMK